MDNEKLIKLYKKMLEIRLVENAIVDEYSAKEIRTPVHLCTGQEAIAAGISANLRKEDCIISNHRCHGHCIAKGISLDGFFLELYGKVGGVSGGKGGSMHLCDMENGIVGTSSIVAGGIPIGAGVALKQKIKKENNITVIYFGDGAVDEGIFWETINFAALKSLPILFVFENNKYASQTSQRQRHSYEDIIPIVKGFGVNAIEVDGNNAIEVFGKSESMIEEIRNGKGPGFISCDTYRWLSHVGPVDDTDTGYRSREELESWKKRCPLDNLEEHLKTKMENTEMIIDEMKNTLLEKISDSIKKAKEAPYAMD